MNNLDIIENVYDNFAWFERATRILNKKERDLCMEFYKKQMSYFCKLEADLLENQLLLSKNLANIKTAKKCLILNNGQFDDCILEILSI